MVYPLAMAEEGTAAGISAFSATVTITGTPIIPLPKIPGWEAAIFTGGGCESGTAGCTRTCCTVFVFTPAGTIALI